MADIILKHNQPDSVQPDPIDFNNEDIVTFKALGADFDITLNDPTQFYPEVKDPILLKNGRSLSLKIVKSVTDSSIFFKAVCSVCNVMLERPAKIIVGTVKVDDPLDRIENKLDGLISEIKKIEQNLNIDN